MKNSLDKFIYNQEFNISINPNSQAFDYSDGQEIEETIFEILNQSTDKSIFSEELRDSIRDWPTEYHFSWERHNLLRHVEFDKDDKILELGCGCGSITRQLAEKGCSVSAVEGSLVRAKATACRCSEFNNVKVYVSNFSDIEFSPDYDYVLLIGVLEYSPKYIKSDSPLSDCIKIAKSALKPSGKLIVAIENRLGLKYFTGIAEDHTGVPYVGLQDTYKPGTVVTLGKGEITKLLSDCGFEHIYFNFPFPDYKLPQVIFTEEAFKEDCFAPSDIISRVNSRDYSSKTKPNFSENLVWPILEVNNLIQDFSNSFLIFASFSNLENLYSNLLATFYSTDRKLEYCTKTEFLLRGESNVIVNKSLVTSHEVRDKHLAHVLESTKYHLGINLDNSINKCILQDNFSEYIKLIKKWINFVIDNGIATISPKNIYLSTLKPEYIDCIPSNLIISDENVVYIDQEWKLFNSFSLTTLIFRYLIKNKHKSLIDNHINGDEKFFIKLFVYLDIPYCDDYFEEYKKIENYLWRTVYPGLKKDLYIPNNKPKKWSIIKRFLPTSLKKIVKKLLTK